MSKQQRIIEELGVRKTFDAADEIERRVGFLTEYLRSAGRRGFVLGISGGIDSTVTGRLAQLAVERLRESGSEVSFYAVRLPYKAQQDEEDAKAALTFIKADHVLTVDIHPAVQALRDSITDTQFRDAAHEDFIIGNAKARMRMVAQYAIAGAHDCLVLGTDHAAEALMGFFTKFGDGAADVVPLTGLTKRRVRAIGAALGAPDSLVNKRPTADLESLAPQKLDEDVFGMSYDVIDDYLEGGQVSAEHVQKIEHTFDVTAHKRALPVAPPHVTGACHAVNGGMTMI